MKTVPASVLACAGLATCAATAFSQGPLTDPFPAVFDLETLDGTQGTRFRGQSTLDRVGFSIEPAGDVNHDGIDDFIMGAPLDHSATTGEVGRAYVIFGRDPSLGDPFPPNLRLGLLDGANGFAMEGEDFLRGWAGWSVHAAGDINGDGVDDVVVGAPGAPVGGVERSGRAYVVYGRDVAAAGPFPPLMALAALDGTNGFRVSGDDDSELGESVSGGSDFNDDGFDDVVFAAPHFDLDSGPGINGRVEIIFGGPRIIRRDELTSRLFIGDTDFGSGRSMDVGGDANGDGLADVLIGAFRKTYVVFGRRALGVPVVPADLDGVVGFELVAGDRDRADDVSFVGDVNGDGVDDMLIGLVPNPPTGEPGRACVVFGRDTATVGAFPARLLVADLDGSQGFVIEGLAADDDIGSQVGGLGDVNGDGFDDMIISAGQYASATGDPVYVVYGRDGATTPFPAVFELASLDGTNGFSMFDATMFGLGNGIAGDLDFNADGVSDILVSTPNARRGTRSDAGVGIVVFGRQPAPPCRADLDGDGSLTLFDFLAFQSAFDLGDLAADFDDDGTLTFFDFLAYQTAFSIGCP